MLTHSGRWGNKHTRTVASGKCLKSSCRRQSSVTFLEFMIQPFVQQRNSLGRLFLSAGGFLSGLNTVPGGSGLRGAGDLWSFQLGKHQGRQTQEQRSPRVVSEVRGHHLGQVRAAKCAEKSSAGATRAAEKCVFFGWTDRYSDRVRERYIDV